MALKSPIILASFLFIFSGCQRTTDTSISKEIKAANINNAGTYEYHTGISGDEEGAEIIQQAAHYELSKIIRDSTTGWEAVYKYKPKAEFKGTDYVEIKLESRSDETRQNPQIKVIRIAIIVN